MKIIQKLQLIHAFLSYKRPKTMQILTLIGALIILAKIFRFLRFLFKNLFRREKNLIKRYGANSWVFISGSSEGIGRAFAHAFAKRNFNIILSARNKMKLEKVQKELKSINSRIQVKSIVIDYKDIDEEKILEGLKSQIQNLDISILINNVGVDVLSYYTNLKEQEIINTIKINCMPQALLTRILLPQFIKRKNKSAIISLASIAGELPMALHNLYTATKSFNDFLSRSLKYQYPNIDIISLHPGEVTTSMTFNKRDILTIQPSSCAQGLIRDLGHESVTNGHISHQIQSWFYSSVPQSLFNYVFKNYVGASFIKKRSQQKIKMALSHSQ